MIKNPYDENCWEDIMKDEYVKRLTEENARLRVALKSVCDWCNPISEAHKIASKALKQTK